MLPEFKLLAHNPLMFFQINNPAASYLATRSGVLNYQFKRLRV